MQNVSSINLFLLEIQQTFESHDQKGHTHFQTCPLKNFASLNLHHHTERCLFYQLLLETWPILEWPHPFFGHAKPKKKIVTNFCFSWICINMIKLISSFFSGDVVEIKNMQSGCPRAFWCIYQETNFSQIWNLCRNKAKT